MNTKSISVRAWVAGLTVLAAFLAGAAPVFPHAVLATPLKQNTAVSVSPAQTNLECNQTGEVDLVITDVQGLSGVDLKLTFDPDIVEVVDADNVQPDVQVQPGDRPDVSGGQGLVQLNEADNAQGVIDYAAIRLGSPAQSGDGIIISITFKGLVAGTSPVTIQSLLLTGPTGNPIQATQANGQITVTCEGQTPIPTTATTATATATRVPGRTGTPTATRPAGKVTPYPPYGKTTPVPGSGQPGDSCRHVVKYGETLYSIASLYGTTVAAIAAANGIPYPDYIREGQALVIPNCGTGKPYPGGDGSGGTGNCFSYTLQYGDSLSTIALTYGDTVAGLAYRNGIANPNLVTAGRTIQVCRGGGSGTGQPYPNPNPYPQPSGCCGIKHVVRPGESLFSIGWRYGGLPPTLIAQCNGLANPNLIYAGQVLCIPGGY